MAWSGCAETAYNNGMNELIKLGYLKQQGKSNIYFFRDKIK